MASDKGAGVVAAPKMVNVKQSKDRVVKRKPARGFHRSRSGILNVTPKGHEKEL